MAMPATHTDWTVEMLDALPDAPLVIELPAFFDEAFG